MTFPSSSRMISQTGISPSLMVIFQHPAKAWQDFASRLPEMPDAKLAHFTTYTLVTGSMFNNMRKHLNGQAKAPTLELKSRDGSLSPQDKQALDQFVGQVP